MIRFAALFLSVAVACLGGLACEGASGEDDEIIFVVPPAPGSEFVFPDPPPSGGSATVFISVPPALGEDAP